MAITVEKNLLNNQSILENFALGEEIDQQAAEIISGGAERFTIRNETQQRIIYTLDDVPTLIEPGQKHRVSTNLGGKITFDRDSRNEIVRPRGYNLSDSQKYVFLPDRNNSNRFNLYQG